MKFSIRDLRLMTVALMLGSHASAGDPPTPRELAEEWLEKMPRPLRGKPPPENIWSREPQPLRDRGCGVTIQEHLHCLLLKLLGEEAQRPSLLGPCFGHRIVHPFPLKIRSWTVHKKPSTSPN